MSNRVYHFLAFCLGFLLLFHGVDKLFNGIDFLDKMLLSSLPFSEYTAPCNPCLSFGMGFMKEVVIVPNNPYLEYLPYVVYTGEVIAPLFLIFLRYIKIASIVIVLYMLLTIFVLYQDKFLELGANGAWSIEVPMLYLIIAVALILKRKER